MKFKDLKAKKAEELDKQVSDMRSELVQLKSQAARGSMKNPHKIQEIKHTIAQILTLRRQRKQEVKQKV